MTEPLVPRDANGRDGEWRYLQLRLPYDVADVLIDGREVTVPVFLPDPEREGWRRRKWWGRGPIMWERGHQREVPWGVTPRYFYKDDWRVIHPTNCGYKPAARCNCASLGQQVQGRGRGASFYYAGCPVHGVNGWMTRERERL